MSLFLKWITGSSEEIEDVLEASAFSTFPIELYETVFEQLNLEDLKSCRLVCFPWYTLLSQHLLRNRMVTVYRDVERSLTGCLGCLCRTRSTQLYGNYLRIAKIHFWNQLPGFLLWTVLLKPEQFQQLELKSCLFNEAAIKQMLLTFSNLTSLTMSDVYLPLGEVDVDITLELKLQNLKELRVSTKNPHAPNRASPITALQWLMEICTKLEVFELTATDTGHSILDSVEGDNDFFPKSFLTFCNVLQTNASTLKSVKLSTYEVQEAKKFRHILVSASELPRREAHALFLRFITDLGRRDWATLEFPLLKKLGLRFRLAMIDESRLYRDNFIPFLSRMTQLREFEFSQIYSRKTYERDNITVLFQSVPPHCRSKIETLHSVRADLNLDEDMALVLQEIQLMGLQEYYPDDIQIHETFQIMDFGDPGYYDSICHFQIGLVQWTVLYAKWREIRDEGFPKERLKFMSKIKIQQPGICQSDKLAIDDRAMQYIIEHATALTHIIIEFANFTQLTDFGLTGLSRDALARIGPGIEKGEDSEIRPGELIGFPVSHLKDLSVMILSCVGEGVTGVSSRFAFGPQEAHILMERNIFSYVKWKPTESWLFNYPFPAPSPLK